MAKEEGKGEVTYVQIDNRTKGPIELNDGKNVIKLGSICDERMFTKPCVLGAEVKAKDENDNEDVDGYIQNPSKLVPVDVWAAFEARPFVKYALEEKQIRVSRPRGA